MAAWDNQNVAVPGGASYAAGLTDFSPLGGLANDFYKGRQNQLDYQKQRTFQDGLPRDAAGNIDFNRAAEMLAVRGDASQLVPLANVDLQRKFLGNAQTDSSAAFPTGPQSPGPQAATGDPAAPRGIRNNNPGNIENGPFAARQPGYSGAESKGRFATFETPQAGVKAAENLLGVYGGQGINTIQGAISRWAPPSDGNDTGAYAATVAKKIGIAPDAPIDLSDPQTRAKVARAMFVVENGREVAGGQEPPVATPERPAIPPHGIPAASPDDAPPAAPVRVAGPGAPTAQPSAPPPQPAPQAAPQATAPQQGSTTMPAALRPMIPAQFSEPMQYVNFLRKKQADYEAAGLAGIKGADGAAKAYGAQADKVMDAIGKFYELTPDQKNAAASGGLNPLQFETEKVKGKVSAENEALTGTEKEARASGFKTPLEFENAKIVAKVAAENSALTPEQKLYEQAVKQGFKGTENEFQAAREGLKKQAQVSAEDQALTPEEKMARRDAVPGEGTAAYAARAAGEKKAAEGEAERYGKKYDTIQESGARALADMPQLGLAKSLMEDPNFYSGAGEKYNLLYKRLLTAVGGDPNTAAPQEAFRKIVSNSILDQIKGMAGTGPIRVAEIKIMEQAAASAENTPAANKVLVEIASRVQARAADLAAMAQNYKGGRLDSGFDRIVRLYDQGKLPEQAMKAYGLQRQGALLNDEEIKNFREIIAPKKAEGAGSSPPPPAGAPTDARQAPDGHWYSPDPARPGKYLKFG